ncbi:MAG TPA: hypothetical protein VGF59_06980 [Bryobacteraceae bacterium]|jgi:hypothetical protein
MPATAVKGAPQPNALDAGSISATQPRPDRGSILGRILLVAYIALIAFPIRYYPVSAGLDPSWAFALNRAHTDGWIFGRDVGFTYGPLAWLTMPMDLGRNLWQGIAFQALFWVLFIAAIAWFAVVRRIRWGRLLAFTVLLLLGLRSFSSFEHAGPEIFMTFLGVLLLGGTVLEERWRWQYGGCWLIGVLLLFVKFSAGMMVTGAAALFCAGLWFWSRRRAVECFWMAAAAPALFVAGYLSYCLSPSALWRYVRSGLEFSSGYSAAMSQAGKPAPLVLAIVILASWLLLVGVLYRRRDRAFPVAFAICGPLFLLFKHSFVREAGHSGLLFAFMPLMWAIVLLFSEWKPRSAREAAPLLLFGAVCIVTMAPDGFGWPVHRLGLAKLHDMEQLLDPSALRAGLASETHSALAEDVLPPEIVARLASESVAIFPYECAYAAANGLNFRPFPVLQSYAAFTPYLDEWNAEFLENPRTAPRFVLFDWKAIDGRHPLLDVPATALALYRNYDFDSAAGGHMLLRRRTAPRFGIPRLVGTQEIRLGQPFPVPSSSHLLIGQAHLKLKASGIIGKFVFRVPEVRLLADSPRRGQLSVRVPPDVLTGGIPLNFLPRDFDEMRGLFSGAFPMRSIDALTISGPGADFFRDSVRMEILEIADLSEKPADVR